MTPSDLSKAWPGGVPTSGRIQLLLAPWAHENAEFRGVIEECVDILAGALTKGLRFFEEGFVLDLTPEPVTSEGVWPLRFQMSQPATDAMAYCLNGIEALLKGIDAPWYTQLNVQPDGAMAAHRLIIPSRVPGALVSDDGTALEPAQITALQHEEITVQLPFGAVQPAEEMQMVNAMFAVGELVDVGAFDLPAPHIEYDTTSPVVALGSAMYPAEIGLMGFRGTGDLGAVLIAAVEKVLETRLVDPVVAIKVAHGI